MNERSSKGKKKREHDFAVTAFRVVQAAIGEATPEEAPTESPEELSPEERHDIAVKLQTNDHAWQ